MSCLRYTRNVGYATLQENTLTEVE